MEPTPYLARLAAFPEFVRVLAAPLSDQDARWRPASGGWSVVEVINHLADEETEDFRQRLARTLADPTAEWAPIDPEGDVARRAYNERDLGGSIERFAAARAETLVWLRALPAPEWSSTYHHPRGIDVSAGDLLLSLGAHDALHLRQLARLLFDLARRDLPEYAAGYAGEW